MSIINNVSNLIASLKDAISYFSIPLKSQFRILEFYGLANGNLLNAFFNQASLQGRKIIIKAIKVIPYYTVNAIDFTISDGVTVNNETIPATARILRVFDDYNGLCNMSMFFNGCSNDMFQTPFPAPAVGASNSYIDLDIDNINYLYPEKIESLGFSVTARTMTNLITGATSVPNVRVFIQCYLV